MKPRNILLASSAAGIVLGGVSWYLTHRLTDAAAVEPLHLGDTFPRTTGTTLSGDTLTLPDALVGRSSVLILADSYAARFEVEHWARHIMSAYGERADLAFYQAPLISVGPIMRSFIDTAMRRGTPPREHRHVLTIYGDLRGLKKRLAIAGRPKAYLFLLDRLGRVVWRTEGDATPEKAQQLGQALAAEGIERIL